MAENKILYRYEGYDSHAIKHPKKFKVHRETKYMYVVYHGYDHMNFPKGKEKFIVKAGKKRYAYPTKEEALVNYIARKRSQIEWSQFSIQNAEKGLFNAGQSVSSVLVKKLTLKGLDDDW